MTTTNKIDWSKPVRLGWGLYLGSSMNRDVQLSPIQTTYHFGAVAYPTIALPVTKSAPVDGLRGKIALDNFCWKIVKKTS